VPILCAIDAWGPVRVEQMRAEHRSQLAELRRLASETLPDGGYRLSVPYADERELLMDILRQGGASKWRRPSLYEDEWPMRQRLLPACIAAVIRSVHEARNLSHFTIG